MNRAEEFAVKRERVERYMRGHGLGGVLLGRTDNFAWLGCGANSVVNSAQETGVGGLVVQPVKVTLVANNIETERLLTEELDGLDIAGTEVFPWHEPGRRDEIVRRLSGGSAFAVDDGADDMPVLPDDFVRLRYSLTEAEVGRYRVLGRDAAAALERAVRAVGKGMTEAEAAGLTARECLSAGIAPIVLLVAADERIRSWRHPTVKDTPIEQYVMVVICGRRLGLVAAGTRLVHFGEVPADLKARHRAVCAVDAAMIAATVPGKAAARIFAEAQAAYSAQGYPDEWQLHHQGGAIGYQPREYIANPGIDETVQPSQAFAWNPSICGTKSEDTVLATADGQEVLTEPGKGWPVIEAEAAGGVIARADILVK